MSLAGKAQKHKKCRLKFNIKKEIGKHLSLKFKAKNMLNSIHKEVYVYNGIEYPYYNFSIGQEFGFGISYKLN